MRRYIQNTRTVIGNVRGSRLVDYEPCAAGVVNICAYVHTYLKATDFRGKRKSFRFSVRRRACAGKWAGAGTCRTIPIVERRACAGKAAGAGTCRTVPIVGRRACAGKWAGASTCRTVPIVGRRARAGKAGSPCGQVGWRGYVSYRFYCGGFLRFAYAPRSQ